MEKNKINYAEAFKEDHYYVKNKKLTIKYCVWKINSSIYIKFESSHSCEKLFFNVKKLISNYKSQYEAIKEKIIDRCSEYYSIGDRFIIMGHSSCGAIAILASEDIGKQFNTKVLVITWGAPKVYKDKSELNKANVFLSKNSKNFQNGSDPTPFLPLDYEKNPYFIHIGKKFNFIKMLLNILFYKRLDHINYDDESLYKNV